MSHTVKKFLSPKKLLITFLAISFNSLAMAAPSSKNDPYLNVNMPLKPAAPPQLNWAPANSSFPFPGVILLLAKDRQGNLYAATALRELYKSSDGGKTWVQLGSSDLTPNLQSCIAHIAVTQNNVIYVADGIGSIFKSADDGATWRHVQSLDGAAADGNTMIAVGNTIYISLNTGQLYRSASNPMYTWKNVPMPADNPSLRALSIYHDGSTIYMQAANITNNSLPLYKLSAGSNSWVLISQKNNAAIPLIREMQFVPQANNKPSIIYATFYNGGAYGVFESKDGGHSWVAKNGAIASAAPYLAAIVNKNIYVTSYAGIYSSTNGGNTWNIENNGIQIIAGTGQLWQAPMIAVRNTLYLGAMNISNTATVIYKARISN